MCRNIKILFNFKPPATELEIRECTAAIRPETQWLQHPVKEE